MRNTYIIMKRDVTKRVLFLTHANLSTHAKIFWIHATRAKILTYAIFLTLAKIYETMPFTPPTSKSDQPHSHQQRYLADSMILNGKT